jgi:hypothetical protein
VIRPSILLATIALALPMAAGPALAHHSFAMFDRTHPAVIEGTVKELQWTNPHVWIQIMVPDGKGGEDEWGVECTSINFLSRMGWTRTTLKPGDKVKLTIYPLRDGSHGGQFGGLSEINGGAVNLQGYSQK